jgi:CBS domain-containing protein
MNRDPAPVMSAPGSDDPPVMDVMTSHLVGITPDAAVSTALRLMAQNGLRHLLVMDGQKCLGMLAEVDLIRCMGQGGVLTPAWSYTVGKIAQPVEALPVTARRSDAARRMANGADAVLVTRGDRLAGIVTTSDLVRSLAAIPRSHRPAAPACTCQSAGEEAYADTAPRPQTQAVRMANIGEAVVVAACPLPRPMLRPSR